MVSGTTQATQLSSLLFSKLDTKKQGYIEKSDLATAFSQIRGKSTSSTGVDKIFSTLDSNSDGKVTESEFASVLGKLQDQLASHRLHHHGEAQGTGKTPPTNNAGFTKDQLIQRLSEAGNTDSARSSLLNKIVNNFTAADANSDGKVSLQEAMAYDKASPVTPAAGSSGNSSGHSATAGNSDDNMVMKKIMQLMHAYGASQGNAIGGIASLVSLVA